MKKKKRILRTVISTVLMCCMLVGDLGSVFATTVDNTEIISEEVGNNGTEQDVQTLSEPIEAPEVDIPTEQPAERLVQEPIEEPKVEVETPVVEEEVPPTEQPPVEETPVEKPQEEKPLEEPKVEPPVVDATVEEPSAGEVTPTESDNWSLDLVFYDSTVDGGRTPLKSIDWCIDDGYYDISYSRDITVQINYKNENVLQDYAPGEVCFKINNLLYGAEDKENLSWSTLVGANDYSHSGYFWDLFNDRNLISNGIFASSQYLNFKNSERIERGSNFEGSIRVVYTIKSNKESKVGNIWNSINMEKTDFCEHTFSNNVTVSYNNKEYSSVDFSYYRKYTHVWNYIDPSHKHNVNKITSYDGLVDAKDYYWVKLTCYSQNITYNGNRYNYPNLKVADKDSYYLITVPDSCVVYDLKGNVLVKEDNVYKVSLLNKDSSTLGECSVNVGFPKNLYEDAEVTVSSSLYGKYENEKNNRVFNTVSSIINLNDYIYEPGELYSFKKSEGFYGSFRYQDIKGNFGNNIVNFKLEPECVYTGDLLTLKFGDDLLFASDMNGSQSRLKDTEYCFTAIDYTSFKNGHGVSIPKGKYDCELWVRYEGENDYELYESFKNSEKTSWSFATSEKSVVGFYITVKNLQESLKINNCYVYVKFFKQDIPENGVLRNYGYSQVFCESNGTQVLQNKMEQKDYQEFADKEEVLEYDLKTYGFYIQRDYEVKDWNYYNLNAGKGYTKARGTEYVIKQDLKNGEFTGSSKSSILFTKLYNSSFHPSYLSQVSEGRYYTGGYIYDILPKGMVLTSSREDILNSISGCHESNNNILYDGCSSSIKYYTLSGLELSHKEFEDLLIENSTVSIVKNWRNTGSTKIVLKVDLSNTPVFIVSTLSSLESGVWFSYNYSIPFDDYVATGNNFYHTVYTEPINRSSLIQPSGVVSDTHDVNDNNITSELLSFYNEKYNIKGIVSTHQDVQTSVQTDKSIYSTGLVKASPESEYTYKLRARSGSNQVSNLVLVNNLEEGYGDNEHWKGDFLGIDTTFAENRIYRVYKPSDPRADAEGYVQERVQVKPYYSTSTTEGELYQTEEKVITDPSGQQITQRVRVLDEQGNFVKNPNWLEYSDSVDKGTVKSLAFEFLDAETGEQAILPENNLIYVEIKMKAPVEAEGLTADGKAKYAYNNCFTQWNALDNMGQPVDFITGINSNTVKVTVNDRVSVQINKVWEDEENKYNSRPDTVEFIMKKDGAEVDRQTLEKGKTTVTFSGLLVDELSSYTFEEVCPSGYTTEGVIYDKVADTYTATNVLDPSSLVEINGTKTWVGDLESERPESITVNLYRNDVKIDSKVVRASDEWSYDFGKFIKNDPDGNKYVYRVEEEPVDGYITNYASAENGLNIKFNSQCKTESANYDYVAIYYKGTDDKFYRLGMWGGTALAGKVVSVPAKDFWLYWRTDSSNSNYYGFSIDSIESANVEATGTAVRLPDYAVEEISGDTYPDSAFDSYTHGNYGNGVNKMWHYTMGVDGFNIVNTSNMTTIEGTKSWEGDTPEVRPDSITVNLLQDGMKIDSVSTDSSKDWKYSFRVPKWDENGREYVYTVSEEPIDGYEASYYSGNGSKITFSADSRTESVSYDYVEIYYEKDGKTYKAGKWGGTTIAGTSVTIPSRDFYLYWRTDGSDCGYYGYRVESIVDTDYNDIIGTVATLPNYTVNDVQSIVELQSGHNPYLNNENKLMLYHGSSVGRYDIKNTLNLTEISGTKHWVGDTENTRPDSITVNLLQDGNQIDSVTTDSSKGWKYSFTAPKFDDTGRDYEYSVSEVPVEGYLSYSGTGARITFDSTSKIEGIDSLSIYYLLCGACYRVRFKRDTNLADYSIEIPSSHFYIEWNKYSNSNSTFRVSSVESVDCNSIIGDRITLDTTTFEEVSDISSLHSNSGYANSEVIKLSFEGNNDSYDITNRLDDITFRFEKRIEYLDDIFKISGINFSLYEGTEEGVYPEAFPGTSNEWVKVSDTYNSEGFSLSGLQSNKTYFLVEDANEVVVSNNGVSTNRKILKPENLCYVVETGIGRVSNVYATIYGYPTRNNTYVPTNCRTLGNFMDCYGGCVEGSELYRYLNDISSRYSTYSVYNMDVFVLKLNPYFKEGSQFCRIYNFIEDCPINVTKKIKASDINFDNGNPTFIYELEYYSHETNESYVADIKEIEFTEEYVESNTDSEGYVSKTIQFIKLPKREGTVVSINEVESSRYNISSVVCDVDHEVLTTPIDTVDIITGVKINESLGDKECNVIFTNDKYENQYYGHNSICVNNIERNTTYNEHVE